jgi:hypothetical protein
MRKRGPLSPVLVAMVVFLVFSVPGIILLAGGQTILGAGLSGAALLWVVLFRPWYNRKYFS